MHFMLYHAMLHYTWYANFGRVLTNPHSTNDAPNPHKCVGKKYHAIFRDNKVENPLPGSIRNLTGQPQASTVVLEHVAVRRQRTTGRHNPLQLSAPEAWSALPSAYRGSEQ